MRVCVSVCVKELYFVHLFIYFLQELQMADVVPLWLAGTS